MLTAVAWVQALVGELRSRRLRGTAPPAKKEGSAQSADHLAYPKVVTRGTAMAQPHQSKA